MTCENCRKMNLKVTLLTAPSLQNSSCSHPRYNTGLFTGISAGDVLQATFVLMLTLIVLLANIVLILVINSRRYSKYIYAQPRYLLTSLASNDLAIGLLVIPFAIVPSLRKCWPYGELVCQIQALLRGALTQQSAVILVCMAVDRYLFMLHPQRYEKHSSKKGCVAIISLTWITSMTLFSILVLPRGGYYFNSSGMVACEPFYSRASIRILTACGFYFPTTMILMYCYGSAFHVNKLGLKSTVSVANRSPEGAPVQENCVGGFHTMEKPNIRAKGLAITTSRTMAAISLGFIVLVTPWTIQEVVVACTGTSAPSSLDFFITWLAMSHTFWNPFLYWLLNNQFRRICRELFFIRILCRKVNKKKNIHHSCCYNSPVIIHHKEGCDFQGLSEKYWGEILDRTLSTNSLHNLTRSFSHPHVNCFTTSHPDFCVLDLGATPDL